MLLISAAATGCLRQLPIAGRCAGRSHPVANASAPRFPELAGRGECSGTRRCQRAPDYDRAGKALASLASAVIKRLWPGGGIVPVALAGGVLQGSPLVRQSFKEAMKVEQPQRRSAFRMCVRCWAPWRLPRSADQAIIGVFCRRKRGWQEPPEQPERQESAVKPQER